MSRGGNYEVVLWIYLKTLWWSPSHPLVLTNATAWSFKKHCGRHRSYCVRFGISHLERVWISCALFFVCACVRWRRTLFKSLMVFLSLRSSWPVPQPSQTPKYWMPLLWEWAFHVEWRETMETEYLQQDQGGPEGPQLLSNQVDPAEGKRERRTKYGWVNRSNKQLQIKVSALAIFSWTLSNKSSIDAQSHI